MTDKLKIGVWFWRCPFGDCLQRLTLADNKRGFCPTCLRKLF